MRIKFLASGVAPDRYEFNGEKIIFNGEEFDLSIFQVGDKFEGIDSEIPGIRAVERIDVELYVTLCQKTPKGHWTGKDEWIDSTEYDPTKLYIRERTPEEVKQLWGI